MQALLAYGFVKKGFVSKLRCVMRGVMMLLDATRFPRLRNVLRRSREMPCSKSACRPTRKASYGLPRR